MESTLPHEGLDEQYQALKTVVENPEFQKVIAEIRSLSPIERVQAAFQQLTPEALAKRGVPIPAILSITTRASDYSATLPTDAVDLGEVGQVLGKEPGLRVETTVCPWWDPLYDPPAWSLYSLEVIIRIV